MAPDWQHINKHEVWTLSDEYEIETSSSPTFQIAFMGYSMLGYGVGIDNVKIVDAAQCYPIASGITVGGDNSQVILLWTAPTGATGYKYILSETELETPDFTSATTITTASMTFDVGGQDQGNLKGETNYWFYVKNDCNKGKYANKFDSIQFTTPETCPSPKNVTVTDVQKYQFTIKWENSKFADEYQKYELIVNTTGEQPDIYDEAQVDEITGTNYTIENLARNTHYYVYMRGTCDDVPEWKLVAEATTLGLGTICDGTETIGTGSESTPLIPFMCVNGTYKTQVIYYPASSLTNCIDKSINGIKFYANSNINGSWNGNRFIIRIGNTSNNQFTTKAFLTESLTEVFNGNVSTNGNNEVIINFAENYKFKYNGNGILIEIEANNTNTGDDLGFKADESTQASYTEYDYDYCGISNPTYYGYVNYLPKVTFTTCEEVKACPEVTKLKANYISYKNATILWDASDGDFLTGYEFVWDDEAITDFSQVPQNQKLNILKNENETIEVTLNNLTPITKYYVYVRALCPNDPDEQQSNWLPIEFTTDNFNCDAPAAQRERSESVTLNDQNPESSIIVYWESNAAQQIELYYTTDDGFEPTSETEANENVTSSDIELGFHAITELNVNTTYYVWARAVCDLEMGNDGKSGWTLMGSATTEADKKFIIFEKVGYTISGIHQGKVTIINTTYDEDDLTPVDYDITYAENEDEEPGIRYDYFNYKYVINVPKKFIDDDQNSTEYEVIAIAANAFDNRIENDNNIRVNISLNIDVDGMSVDEM